MASIQIPLFTCLLLTLASPTLAQLCDHLSLGYDAVYDLQNEAICTSPHVTISTPFDGSGCKAKGVLKLDLTDTSRNRVLIDFYFDNPTDWVFNLGDSKTNDGSGGDDGTTNYNAEVEGLGQSMAGYRSEVAGGENSFSQSNAYNTRLTLLAENGKVTWLSDTSFNSVTDAGLYALAGQDDNILYLGLNRVVYGSSNSGTGLCKAAIKFLP